eukprot:gene24280-9879_t
MATLVEVDAETIDNLRAKLTAPDTDLAEKYRVLFSLRNIAGEAAHQAMLVALKDPSDLFRHDVCFCLGQRQDDAAVKILTEILLDSSDHPMVRHEAGEALGAIGSEACLGPLKDTENDDVLEVAETCQLAVRKMEHLKAAKEAAAASGDESKYMSVDPTPALPSTTPTEELKEILLDESRPMFERYGALFGLRNKGGKEAVDALGSIFHSTRSALIKHEVAYVFGQMQEQHSTSFLVEVLKDTKEHAMVRHEAAEALGAIADSAAIALLKEYSADAEPIVAHSCVVALDMLEFEQSGAFQYASTEA